MDRLLIATFLYLFCVLKSNPISRNCNQIYEGWTIADQQCIFKEDIDNCQNPLLFQSWEDCLINLLGTDDYCSIPRICNTGFCASTRSWTGRSSYKCYCDGTGYYGRKCEQQCPRTFPMPRSYPIACILI